MQPIDIHGMKVHVEDDHSAKLAAEFLKKNPDAAQAYFHEAKRIDGDAGIAHFETPHDGEHHGASHHFTLVHTGSGEYELRRRTGY